MEQETTPKLSSVLLNGIVFENPVFVQLLGMCPTLATSSSVKNALGMGLSATAVLICSNLAISALRKLIPDKARSGEFFGFFDIFGKFSSIMGPALVGFVSAFTANKMLADQGLTAATATAEQVDAINAAAGPFGILSVILIIILFHFTAVLHPQFKVKPFF